MKFSKCKVSEFWIQSKNKFEANKNIEEGSWKKYKWRNDLQKDGVLVNVSDKCISSDI